MDHPSWNDKKQSVLNKNIIEGLREDFKEGKFYIDKIILYFEYIFWKYRGKNILDQKLTDFYETLVVPTDGQILKLFDSHYYKKFRTGVKTLKAVTEELKDTEKLYNLDLETFLKNNQKLITLEGYGSQASKHALLKETLQGIDHKNHYMMTDYYTRGMNLFLGSRVLIRMLIRKFPKEQDYIKKRAQEYSEFQLYEIYKELKENNFKDTESLETVYKPMLAINKDVFKTRDLNYAIEPKIDGIRLLIRKSDKELKFWSRSGQTFNVANFLKAVPCLEKFLNSCDFNFVIDGELWVNNLPSGEAFRRLSPLIKTKKEIDTKGLNFKYTIFDIIEFKDKKTISYPHKIRRKILKKQFTQHLNNNVGIIRAVKLKNKKHLDSLLAIVKEKDLEGLVLKRIDSPYEPNQRNWVKVKFEDPTIDVLLKNPEKAKWGRHKIKNRYTSFEVFVKHNGALVSMGKIGAGFKDRELEDLKGYFLERDSLMAEIRCNAILKSPSNSSCYGLRFPRFIRYRPDLEQPNELDYILELYKEKIK